MAGDPFVRRLVQRLLDPAQPLSRNRHPATFETPEGREALKVFRRLRSVRRDVLAGGLGAEGVTVTPTAEDDVLVSIDWPDLHLSRKSRLARWEYRVLCSLPDVGGLLLAAEGGAPQRRRSEASSAPE